MTGSGILETKKTAQSELTLREVTSNELEFLIDVGGGGPAAAAPPRPRVTIAASDPSAGEPADPATIEVTRGGSTAAPLTVFLTASGTAAAGGDYLALPASVIIPAGAASVSLTLTPIDDGAFETPETVVVTVTPNAAYVVGTPGSATVTVASEDGTVTVQTTDAAAAEPNNVGRFQFSRTGTPLAAQPALTVLYTVSGTATAADYTGLSGSVTIPAGAASALATVTPVNDGLTEDPETVMVTITPNAAAYAVGSPAAATVTLTSDDGVVTVVANDASAAEPTSTGQFRFTRAGTPAASLPAVTVSYSVSGTATAGTDYTALAGSVTIPAGVASALVTVTPVDDGELEPSETVIVTVTPGLGLRRRQPQHRHGQPHQQRRHRHRHGERRVRGRARQHRSVPVHSNRHAHGVSAGPDRLLLRVGDGHRRHGLHRPAGSVTIPAGVASARSR